MAEGLGWGEGGQRLTHRPAAGDGYHFYYWKYFYLLFTYNILAEVHINVHMQTHDVNIFLELIFSVDRQREFTWNVPQACPFPS